MVDLRREVQELEKERAEKEKEQKKLTEELEKLKDRVVAKESKQQKVIRVSHSLIE